MAHVSGPQLVQVDYKERMMSVIEVIHALGIGIDDATHPEEFNYLYGLLLKWTTSQT